MDLGEADELDYEENELANEYVDTGSQSKDSSGNSNLSGSDDQYLQIDCEEEDESFFSNKTAGDNVRAEIQNVKIDSEDGKSKIHNRQNFLSEIEQFTQINSSKRNGNNEKTITITTTNKKKKRLKAFKPRPEIKETIVKGLNLSSRLPLSSFRVSQNVVKTHRLSVCCNQQKILNRDFYPNKSPSLLLSQQEKHFQPLMTIKSKQVPLSSFAPIGTVTKRYNLARYRNKPFSRHLPGPLFNKNHSKFQIENKKIALFENVECRNIKPEIIAETENIKKTSVFEQKVNIKNRKNQESFSENFQAVEAQRNFKRRIFHNQNHRGPCSDVKFGEFGFTRNNNTFLDTQYNFLKDDEKKLIILKKEARLKRFSHDDMVLKERIPVDSADSPQKCLYLEEEYFQKMAEQKLIRERFLSLKWQRRKNSNYDSDQNALLEKPNLNKESLLKKKNPFDEISGASKLLSETKIKQESETGKEVKEEYVDEKFFASIKINSQFMKNDIDILTTLGSAGQSFCPAKNEKSPVRIFRTLSKGFDELTFKKPKAEVILNRNINESSFSYPIKTFPTTEENKMNTLIRNFPAQTESHLTGCIVKVLNIPPSTTTNDILALCCPAGLVREVKLNYPKENSVVIRFVEPACAEKFFSLYHGQKMNNYFLNVIVV